MIFLLITKWLVFFLAMAYTIGYINHCLLFIADVCHNSKAVIRPIFSMILAFLWAVFGFISHFCS